MKTFAILFFLTIPFLNTVPITAELNVEHEIEAITIYLNSAEITRKATLNIPVGKSELVFEGISSRILNQGLKVNISNDVKVYAVNIGQSDRSIEDTDEWKILDLKRDSLTEVEKQAKIELNTLEMDLAYLKSNMKIQSDNEVTFSNIDEGAKYFREKTKAIQIKIQEEDRKIKNITNERKKLLKESNKLNQAKRKVNKNIRITVINEQASSCEIELRYLVSNAVWKPYYSLRANDKDQPITIEYQAQIYNDTGNEWTNKPITLAIMDPSDDVSKPKLDAWVLEDDYNSDQYSYEGKLSKAKGRYSKSRSSSRSKKNEEEQEYDVLQIDDLSTRFEIEDLHVIPSDAAPHLIDVTTYTKDINCYTLSIPKVKEGAFLIARIQDWESLGLLDGPMNLYYKNSFQGVSQLDTRQVGDTLDISLGKDNSFNIIRRKISSSSSEKLIGFNIKEVLTYEIIVKNNKDKVLDIEVRDQLPLSTEKDVEVKPIDISRAKLDVLSGQLSWNLKLNPNESKKITLKFSVKYPKKKRGLLDYTVKKFVTPRYF